MPILMPLPPPPTQEVRSLYEITDSPSPSGQEGQELLRQFETVYRQWHERTVLLTENDGEIIEHVPFETAGTIKVRFRNATPMSPRQVDYEGLDQE